MRRAAIISLLLLWVWIAFTVSAEYYLVNGPRAIRESDLKLLPAGHRSRILYSLREAQKVESDLKKKPQETQTGTSSVVPPPPPGFILEPRIDFVPDSRPPPPPARQLNVWHREVRINYVLLVWFLLPPVLLSPLLRHFWKKDLPTHN